MEFIWSSIVYSILALSKWEQENWICKRIVTIRFILYYVRGMIYFWDYCIGRIYMLYRKY